MSATNPEASCKVVNKWKESYTTYKGWKQLDKLNVKDPGDPNGATKSIFESRFQQAKSQVESQNKYPAPDGGPLVRDFNYTITCSLINSNEANGVPVPFGPDTQSDIIIVEGSKICERVSPSKGDGSKDCNCFDKCIKGTGAITSGGERKASAEKGIKKDEQPITEDFKPKYKCTGKMTYQIYNAGWRPITKELGSSVEQTDPAIPAKGTKWKEAHEDVIDAKISEPFLCNK